MIDICFKPDIASLVWALPGDTAKMPRFFIDTDDGDMPVRDEEGEEFGSLQQARDAAIASLPDLASDKLPDGERRTFRAAVLDEARATLYVATLTYEGEWKVTPPAG